MHVSAISVDPQIFTPIHNSAEVPVPPFLLLFAIYVRLCALPQVSGVAQPSTPRRLT